MFIRAVITVAVGYLLGNLNGAVWLSKMIAHDDVRCHGSGNAGFTNFCRNYGALTGLLVFVIDAAKAVAACILGQRLFAPLGYGLEGAALAAVAVGLGHDFPALLGFHGGKGIVCGVASATVMDWRVGLVALAAFLVAYLLTRYVSLGSVATGILFPVMAWVLFRDPVCLAFALLVGGLIVFQHRGNISRLIHGTESKFSFHHHNKE